MIKSGLHSVVLANSQSNPSEKKKQRKDKSRKTQIVPTRSLSMRHKLPKTNDQKSTIHQIIVNEKKMAQIDERQLTAKMKKRNYFDPK